MQITDLDTPALIVDVEVMEANLARVAEYARNHGLRLRPHTKTHKIPSLARRQVEKGACGITVAKTGEAEVMAQATPPEMLVAYPVIGQRKLDRLMQVARGTDLTVALDNLTAATELSEAAQRAGIEVGVLAEIDAGLHRVGVSVGKPLRDLARAIASLPGLSFRGIAFYPGHIKRMDEAAVELLEEVDGLLAEAIALLNRDGHEVPVVSGGSTPALFSSHVVTRVNEIRPGTYIFNDRNTWMLNGCELADCAASVLATVVSTSVTGQMIIDGGSKTFSSDGCAAGGRGFGYIREAPEAEFTKMNEEHGFIDLTGVQSKFKVGDRVRVVPNHICTAVNLHEQIYGVRGEEVVETWRVEARGKLQ
jgi:D-serine deaminase-like pyridoxal phosphate-dependent protein